MFRSPVPAALESIFEQFYFPNRTEFVSPPRSLFLKKTRIMCRRSNTIFKCQQFRFVVLGSDLLFCSDIEEISELVSVKVRNVHTDGFNAVSCGVSDLQKIVLSNRTS